MGCERGGNLVEWNFQMHAFQVFAGKRDKEDIHADYGIARYYDRSYVMCGRD